MANMANITLHDLAVGPPNSPGGLHAEASAPSLQPVLALITQGLNMHATRLDALARALARLERGALQQVESAEMARAEAERRAAEAYAHASEAYARAEAAETHAEAQLQAAVQASEGRTAAKHITLERRLAELEARLDTLPPALEELRGRSSAHELVLATHEREIATERSERTAEISEQREAHAALSSRVDQSRADAAAALAAAQESNHAAHARLRETLGEHAERQRRNEARTSAVEEALPQHQEMIEELQQAHSTLQRAVTAEAAEAEKTRAHMAQLATVQAQLEQAQAQLSDTVQLGLARAVAAAETMRDDSDRISSALAELEGWSRRLERLEVDLSAAERRLDGAAEELRRQAASLEGAQRTSMLSATQQVALHVKALSGDLIKELQTKATIEDSQQLFDAIYQQLRQHKEMQKTLLQRIEAHGVQAEQLAQESSTAALQAQAALRSAERVRELLLQPLEVRLEALELGRRRLEVYVEEGMSARWKDQFRTDFLGKDLVLRDAIQLQLRDELRALRVPSLEQLQSLHEALSHHIQRLPSMYPGFGTPHGRWTWTRGKLRAASGRAQPPLLPWNQERLNTAPDVFGWVADRAHIEVLQSGMYVVACAVFVPGAPPVGVSINGQTVLRRGPRSVSSSRQVIDASGLIAGSSLRDVVSLAPNSRVAINCEVNLASLNSAQMQDAHALLEIKKLW
ncbi:hypothetical protein Ctob_000915 [Chrysochromulina tobinii]|uniref:Uncharacterized protein n=1 Tax=Chrysochromulina tobinii TaxID=1460289 RepID=A0A0M0J2X2_9EUKA|nr:hypothetical protein Ctob_000915 [Chrysochromulina tobinii]|eukprot:KOO20891.1 hypothetical protein Ctob_000915 [Chrysochromulina sp. CCMP291]